MSEASNVQRWRGHRVAVVALVAMLVAACGGSVATQSNQGPGAVPLSSVGSRPSASSSAAPSRAPSPSRSQISSPSESPLDLIDFEVSGSIAGKQVTGKLGFASFTVPCVGGGNQTLIVHWTGTASGSQLQSEIDFKPGIWTIGSASAQGVATIWLLGGKATDNLAAASGTVTTGPTGGSIDGTFTGGSDSLHLSGTWTCPTTSS